MKDDFIYTKSLEFGVRCVKFYQYLKEKGVYVVGKEFWFKSDIVSETEYLSINKDLNEIIALRVASINNV